MSIKQVLTYNTPMNILGIESSCDDTGLAIVDSSGQIIAHVTSSQHQIHARSVSYTHLTLPTNREV